MNPKYAKYCLTTAAIILILPGRALASHNLGHHMMEIGREYGWIQATCSYALIGWLKPMQAERVLRVYFDAFETSYGKDSANDLAASTLEKYPKCRQYWPLVD